MTQAKPKFMPLVYPPEPSKSLGKGVDPKDPKAIAAYRANQQRLHQDKVQRHEARLAAGCVGTCRLCDINVYGDTSPAPSDEAMPCNVVGCPFERPEDQQTAVTEKELRFLLMVRGG